MQLFVVSLSTCKVGHSPGPDVGAGLVIVDDVVGWGSLVVDDVLGVGSLVGLVDVDDWGSVTGISRCSPISTPTDAVCAMIAAKLDATLLAGVSTVSGCIVSSHRGRDSSTSTSSINFFITC